MKKTPFYNLVGFILLTVLICACADKPKGGRTDTYSSGAISFASDESFSPIIDEQIQVFESIYRDADVKPLYMNEVDAIKLLMNDSLNLVITARAFTANELEVLRSKTYSPVAIPLGYDGLSLIINKHNTDSCITVNDVKRILSGEATKWSDVVSGSTRGDIQVVFDNAKSSTVRWCVDSLLSGKLINSPNIVATNNSKEVISFVEETPNAIGIIGSNWLTDKRDTTNTTWKKNITVMSVSKQEKATPYNSWKPYQAWLLDGRYPFVRTLYALLNDPLRGLPWGFAHFIEQPKGQLIIFQSGLLPYRGDLEIRDVNVKTD